MKKSGFGDILEKWENGAHNPQKKAMMNEWLQNNEIYDKDANSVKTAAPGENRRRLLQKRPDDIIDIHGFTVDKAWLALDRFFADARDHNYEKLRIIHGKGNHSNGEGILGSTVKKYIEKCAFAGESGYEKSANGGSGATWVLLKD